MGDPHSEQTKRVIRDSQIERREQLSLEIIIFFLSQMSSEQNYIYIYTYTHTHTHTHTFYADLNISIPKILGYYFTSE